MSNFAICFGRCKPSIHEGCVILTSKLTCTHCRIDFRHIAFVKKQDSLRRINDQVTANFGASFLPGGSESYLVRSMPAVALRAGISFKVGKSYASSSANRMSTLNDDTWNSYQLSEAQREVDGLRNKVARLEPFKPE